MSETGAGMNVGDCILTLLCNTTQLDQAFDAHPRRGQGPHFAG
jgi:hypothetical protein